MGKRARYKTMVQSYGDVPDLTYFPGDMASIRSYFDYMQVAGDDSFLIDDATWDDLDMDAVFRRMNLGLSNSGEQYLYYLLRVPAMEEAEFHHRGRLVALMETGRELREKLHYLFAALGRRSRVNIFELLETECASTKNIYLYAALAVALVISVFVAIFALSVPALLLAIALACTNSALRHYKKSDQGWQINTVEYCAAMVATQRKLCDMGRGELEEYLGGAKTALGHLKSFRGPGMSMAADDLAELVNNFLLIDLILFERQKNDLARYREDFLTIHRTLGRLDASISIASYRKSVPVCTVPTVSYGDAPPALFCREMVHPLVVSCVPNNVDLDRSILITGSNASGKSTFLRTLAINVILAQGVCTALAKEFRCGNVRVFSSIDIRDSLSEGDSYYISELKSLRKIVDGAKEPGAPVFCCLDEIFRGTNAVERIAASAEILSYLARHCLCAAATHDVELCAILSQFSLCHFSEHITGSEMCFDYLLKPGYATTSNAIKLLGVMGFPADIVARAETRAATYREAGRWD